VSLGGCEDCCCQRVGCDCEMQTRSSEGCRSQKSAGQQQDAYKGLDVNSENKKTVLFERIRESLCWGVCLFQMLPEGGEVWRDARRDGRVRDWIV
jgi:hypothetical protein